MKCDFEVWPGPMEGVGRDEFVRIASSLRLIERWMTPFIRITGSMPSVGRIFAGIASYLESGVPVTVQLMGKDAAAVGACARILDGHPAVSGINLNLGCPSARVVSHGAGGGLLRKPETIAGFCQRVAAELPGGRLSVKLRAGFSSSADMDIFLPALAASGCVDKIFFHYRTVGEGYSDLPLPERDSRIARAVVLSSGVPVIANGDIHSVDEAERVVAATGAAGVMIARPWMKDPFLLRRFRGDAPEAEEGRELFFGRIRAAGLSGGPLKEIARMLWGADSARFRRLLAENG